MTGTPDDRGIWATWYDLDEADRDEFFSWMEETYLPALADTGTYRWIAHYANQPKSPEMDKIGKTIMARSAEQEGVEPGTQFLFLVGGTTPGVFLDPLVLDQPDGGVPGSEAMLSRRKGTRHALFVEQDRVQGPEIGDPAVREGPSPAIQMGAYRLVSTEHEWETSAWYIQSRMRLLSEMPGCVRVRKLMNVAGWAKHSVLYEFTSLEQRYEHFEKKLEVLSLNPPEGYWTIARHTYHAPGSPTIAERTWSWPA